MEKEKISNDIRPGSQETVKFWNGIWDLPVRHNKKAQQFKKVETQLRGAKKQENITENLEEKKNSYGEKITGRLSDQMDCKDTG